MQFTTSSLIAIMASVVVATEQLQINYYSDACQSYVGQVDVTWATNLYNGKDNCYNYNYGTSVNIANCYESSCLCNFYNSKNCEGASYQATNSGNCLQNSAALNSFACYYT